MEDAMCDTISFPIRKINKTRKDRKCFFCYTSIPKGQTAYYYPGIYEGQFFTVHCCPICNAFREAFPNFFEGEWDEGSFNELDVYQGFIAGIIASKIHNL